MECGAGRQPELDELERECSALEFDGASSTVIGDTTPTGQVLPWVVGARGAKVGWVVPWPAQQGENLTGQVPVLSDGNDYPAERGSEQVQHGREPGCLPGREQ